MREEERQEETEYRAKTTTVSKFPGILSSSQASKKPRRQVSFCPTVFPSRNLAGEAFWVFLQEENFKAGKSERGGNFARQIPRVPLGRLE